MSPLKKLLKHSIKFAVLILSFLSITFKTGICYANNAGNDPVAAQQLSGSDSGKNNIRLSENQIKLLNYLKDLLKIRNYYIQVKNLYGEGTEPNAFLEDVLTILNKVIYDESHGRHYLYTENQPMYKKGANVMIYTILYNVLNIRETKFKTIINDWDKFPYIMVQHCCNNCIEPRLYLGKASDGYHYCFMLDYRNNGPHGGLKLFKLNIHTNPEWPGRHITRRHTYKG